MQGFEPFFYKVLVFDKFNTQFHKGGFLKPLLEDRPYAYLVKCGPDSIFSFKGPIKFISNDDIHMLTYNYVLLGK